MRGKSDYSVDRGVDDFTGRAEKVSEYFMSDRRSWDEVKVRSTFNNSDAEVNYGEAVSLTKSRCFSGEYVVILCQSEIDSGEKGCVCPLRA